MKKMKNCEGSRLKPAKKYKMMLKQVAIANLTGISAITVNEVLGVGCQQRSGNNLLTSYNSS